MAQRKPSSGGKPAAKKGTSRPAGKPGVGSSAKAGAASAPQLRKKPPARKPGKSIVNQKQTPWGTIITIVAVLAFAGAVIGIVIATHKSSPNITNRYRLPELAAAKAIKGVVYKQEPAHTHIFSGTATYDTTPPTGGNHSPFWADCNGTVYPQPIANENAVHPLEHGAVWVTYRQGLPASEVSTLAKDVTGQDHVFMSPYPNLKTKVSLQAWGYQLFVNSVTDPRITQFISTLAANAATTPEVDPTTGQAISCAQPSFKLAPSTFGHPLFAPQAPATSSSASTPSSTSSGGSSAAGSSAP
jgi:Protein of unknown function (DUF3105)